MKHIEDTFQGTGNVDLYYQCWLPSGEPEAIILIVHGLAEHSSRYANPASYFVSRGLAVCGFDLRGHGKSGGPRGYVERFPLFLDDLDTFVNIVRSRFGAVNLFIWGHSMGGTIATAYAIQHQNEFDGLIVTGMTLLLGGSVSPAQIALAKILSLLVPKMGIAVIDASAISRDKAVVDAYVHDPLVYRGKISARLGAEFLKAMRALRDKLSAIDLPILIMHGTIDRLSEPGSSQLLYDGVSSRDKTLKLYQGFYHEIFNEPGQEQVLADMETWLSAHL